MAGKTSCVSAVFAAIKKGSYFSKKYFPLIKKTLQAPLPLEGGLWGGALIVEGGGKLLKIGGFFQFKKNVFGLVDRGC